MLEDDIRRQKYDDYMAVVAQNQATALAIMIGSEWRPPNYMEFYYPEIVKNQRQTANEAAKAHIQDVFGVTFEEVQNGSNDPGRQSDG